MNENEKDKSFDNANERLKMSLINFNQKGMSKRIDILENSIDTLKKQIKEFTDRVNALEGSFKNLEGNSIHEKTENKS